MTLGQKLKNLRGLEGQLRGLSREMTQSEIAHAIREELGEQLSQPYLSQLENGHRPHLTTNTRTLLARFFKVHPGYLVDDPEGFRTELTSPLRIPESQLDGWLLGGAERFGDDLPLAGALRSLAADSDSRGGLLLLAEILKTPSLAEELRSVLLSREQPQ